MIELVRQARDAGTVSGLYLDIAQALTTALRERKGKEIPINVDGAFAIVLAELGFAPPLGRGVFVLARSVGLLAHAWETMQEGRRIKGPVPPQVMYSYVRSEEHTSELQSLMRISYAVFCLKKKKKK